MMDPMMREAATVDQGAAEGEVVVVVEMAEGEVGGGVAVVASQHAAKPQLEIQQLEEVPTCHEWSQEGRLLLLLLHLQHVRLRLAPHLRHRNTSMTMTAINVCCILSVVIHRLT